MADSCWPFTARSFEVSRCPFPPLPPQQFACARLSGPHKVKPVSRASFFQRTTLRPQTTSKYAWAMLFMAQDLTLGGIYRPDARSTSAEPWSRLTPQNLHLNEVQQLHLTRLELFSRVNSTYSHRYWLCKGTKDSASTLRAWPLTDICKHNYRLLLNIIKYTYSAW